MVNIPTPIVPDPARWNYGFDANGQSQATYPGQVIATTAAPNFRVTQPSAGLAPVVNTALKIPWQNVVNDAMGWWDGTNNRWVPKVAGFYYCNARLQYGTAASTVFGSTQASLRKNGVSIEAAVVQFALTAQALASSVGVASIIQFNGSTDFLELFGLFSTETSGTWTTPTFTASANAFLEAFYLGN